MQIVTERLLMRDFTADDWPAVLGYQRHPLYLRYNPWTERTPAEAQTFVGWFLAQQQENPRTKFQLALVLASSGQLIGNCGIRRSAPGSHEADIGYELDPAYWGQGYASEAARAIVQFGFGELGLHRVSADCVADNTPSAHVLEKLGMRLEGRLPHKQYFKGRWWDTLLYAMLEDEWRGVLKNCHQTGRHSTT